MVALVIIASVVVLHSKPNRSFEKGIDNKRGQIITLRGPPFPNEWPHLWRIG